MIIGCGRCDATEEMTKLGEVWHRPSTWGVVSLMGTEAPARAITLCPRCVRSLARWTSAPDAENTVSVALPQVPAEVPSEV